VDALVAASLARWVWHGGSLDPGTGARDLGSDRGREVLETLAIVERLLAFVRLDGRLQAANVMVRGAVGLSASIRAMARASRGASCAESPAASARWPRSNQHSISLFLMPSDTRQV
jgi:hypothetical protein